MPDPYRAAAAGGSGEGAMGAWDAVGDLQEEGGGAGEFSPGIASPAAEGMRGLVPPELRRAHGGPFLCGSGMAGWLRMRNEQRVRNLRRCSIPVSVKLAVR